MCSEQQNEKKPKNTRPQAFTSVTAKEAQLASARSRSLRAKMREQLLQVAVSEGIEKLFAKALKSRNLDDLELVERASKLTGLDFASSEEAIKKIDVKSDNKVDSKLEIVVKDA